MRIAPPAGVLTAHFATLHLFHGGHYISVRGPLCSSNTGRLELFDLVEIVALYLVPQGGGTRRTEVKTILVCGEPLAYKGSTFPLI